MYKKTIRFTGKDEESQNMGIYPNSDESKEWHAEGVTSDYTLCGMATADGQDIKSRNSNIVTCPCCIRIIMEASKYKIKTSNSRSSNEEGSK